MRALEREEQKKIKCFSRPRVRGEQGSPLSCTASEASPWASVGTCSPLFCTGSDQLTGGHDCVCLPYSQKDSRGLTTRCSQTSGAWGSLWLRWRLGGIPFLLQMPRSWSSCLGARWKEMRLRHHPGQGPLEGPSAVSGLLWPHLGLWRGGWSSLLGVSRGILCTLSRLGFPGWEEEQGSLVGCWKLLPITSFPLLTAYCVPSTALYKHYLIFKNHGLFFFLR